MVSTSNIIRCAPTSTSPPPAADIQQASEGIQDHAPPPQLYNHRWNLQQLTSRIQCQLGYPSVGIQAMDRLPPGGSIHTMERLPPGGSMHTMDRLPLGGPIHAMERLPPIGPMHTMDRLPPIGPMHTLDRPPPIGPIHSMERLPPMGPSHTMDRLPSGGPMHTMDRLPSGGPIHTMDRLPLGGSMYNIERLGPPYPYTAVQSPPPYSVNLYSHATPPLTPVSTYPETSMMYDHPPVVYSPPPLSRPWSTPINIPHSSPPPVYLHAEPGRLVHTFTPTQ